MTVKKAARKELLDSLLADYPKPKELIAKNGMLKHHIFGGSGLEPQIWGYRNLAVHGRV